MNVKLIVLALVSGAYFIPHPVYTCNETICGPIVSKCLLTEACSCDIENCTCCKDCSICLANMFVECCSCLKLCPELEEDQGNLSKTSNVEDFSDSVPELFKILTEYPDPLDRWSVYNYPIEIDSSTYLPKMIQEFYVKTSENETNPKSSNIVSVNCTVAYLSRCMSSTKCKTSCQTMGSASYRWFHDGCCECVGNTCINYGINESKCLRCGLNQNEDDYLDPEEDLEYGESEDVADYGEDAETYERRDEVADYEANEDVEDYGTADDIIDYGEEY